MTDLSDLISRLEAATEGSRELDGDIAEALGIASAATRGIFGMARQKNKKGYFPVDRGEWYRSTPTNESWKAPHYTTSIDAALTLMLSERGIEMTIEPDGATQVSIWGEPSDAATPALALCAAFLKARSDAPK